MLVSIRPGIREFERLCLLVSSVPKSVLGHQVVC